MPSTTICTNAFGEDWIVEFSYRVTNPGCAAQIFGPPERCYPAEPFEYEAEVTALRRDVPKPDVSNYASPELAARRLAEWAAKAAPIPLTPEFTAVVNQWLAEDQSVYDAIRDDDQC